MLYDDETHDHRRRLFLTGLMAVPLVTACGAILEAADDFGDPATLNDAFDGRYEIEVSRFRIAPKDDGSPPSSRPLATIQARVINGVMAIDSVTDLASGENYQDFKGFFSDDGRLRIRTTAGYLTGGVGQSVLDIDQIVGRTLLAGETVTVQPTGFGDNYAAVVKIRFLGV